MRGFFLALLFALGISVAVLYAGDATTMCIGGWQKPHPKAKTSQQAVISSKASKINVRETIRVKPKEDNKCLNKYQEPMKCNSTINTGQDEHLTVPWERPIKEK